MSYDPIQDQIEVPDVRLKVAKMADFKGYLLHWYAYNQKTDGELWYSKTISKF